MLMLLYDSLNLVVIEVKLWTVTGHNSGDKEVQSLVLQQLDCVEHKMHWCTVLPKDKML